MSAIRGNKSELAYCDGQIIKEIRGHMALRKLSMETLAHRLGMSERTLARRLARPREFTLCELRKLQSEMLWSEDTRRKLFF